MAVIAQRRVPPITEALIPRWAAVARLHSNRTWRRAWLKLRLALVRRRLRVVRADASDRC